MDEEWRTVFLMRSETDEFRKRLAETQDIIKQAFNEFKKPYVAYSGGKDSLVLLHLVLQYGPYITVFHWDYGPYYIPRKIEARIIQIAREIGAKNIVVKTSRLYEKYKRNAQNVLGRVLLGIIVPQMAKEGYDACFLGLRAEESIKRKLRTRKFFERGTYMTHVFPLKNWTWLDVWAYIISKNLPYLKEHYDKYAKVLGYNHTRFVTYFDKEFEKFGSSNIDGILNWKFKHND